MAVNHWFIVLCAKSLVTFTDVGLEDIAIDANAVAGEKTVDIVDDEFLYPRDCVDWAGWLSWAGTPSSSSRARGSFNIFWLLMPLVWIVLSTELTVEPTVVELLCFPWGILRLLSAWIKEFIDDMLLVGILFEFTLLADWTPGDRLRSRSVIDIPEFVFGLIVLPLLPPSCSSRNRSI